jgi:hypothetical protein
MTFAMMVILSGQVVSDGRRRGAGKLIGGRYGMTGRPGRNLAATRPTTMISRV